jgi:hypothetical protein
MDPNDPPSAASASIAGPGGLPRSRPGPEVASRRRPSRSRRRVTTPGHWVAALSWASIPVDRQPGA